MPSYSELLHQQIHETYLGAHMRVAQDFDAVYNRNEIIVGWPERVRSLAVRTARPNSTAIIGMRWGDEGKGRLIDNQLDYLINELHLPMAYVIRFQGGSNAGHTIYKGSEKIALHQVPSGILYPEAVGIMDRGMVIHMEDLQTEIVDAEKKVGDLRGKLILSEDAMLATDMERAEEVFLREKSSGKSEGGTGRGMGPTEAHYKDRQGNLLADLIAENWEEVFDKKYDQYQKDFGAWGKDIGDYDVPDLRETRDQKQAVKRKVGSKQDYLNRLRSVRSWFIDRDASIPGKEMIQNTFPLHSGIEEQLISGKAGALFEGAQAVGLHFSLGRYPDTTPSDTTMNGIPTGTRYWTRDMVGDGTGVFKVTYDSSVGSLKPITIEKLPTDVDPLAKRKAQMQEEWKTWSEADYWREINALTQYTPEQKHALWIREVAHEKGTTTGRYRDICYLDLESMRYNAKMSGVNMLAGTHLDIARADQPIRVCTHYVDAQGKYHPYEPGHKRQAGLTPQYIDLPGFDGEAVKKAKTFEDLPENAQKLLAFIQRQMGLPITFVTTGPERQNALEIPKFEDKKQFFAQRGNIYDQQKAA